MNILPKLQNVSPFILLATALFYLSGFFSKYLSSPYVGGWDGDGHFAIMLKYSRDIFPQIIGWNWQSDLGMPWSLGYPPLSSIIFAIWERLLPWQPLEEFKLLFILFTLITPLLIYFLARQLGFRAHTALLSGFLMLLFLASTATTEYVGGITLRATFGFGLYPQLMAFVFLILWLIFFLKAGWYNQSLSLVLFASILLTNIHVAFPAAVLWLTITLTKVWINKKNGIGQTLSSSSLYIITVIVVSGFWLLPLMRNYPYLLSLTQINLDPAIVIANYWPYWLTLLAGLTISLYRRYYSLIAIGFAALILLCTAVLPIYQLLPILPLQPDRILPLTMVISLLMLGVVVEQLRNTKLQVGSVALFTLLLFVITPLPQNSVGGQFRLSDSEQQMVDYVKQFNDGRSLVEAWYDPLPDPDPVHVLGQPTHNLISAGLMQNSSHESLISIFRESSFSSPFTQPVRNTFSAQHHDAYGVACWLCDYIHNNAAEYMQEYNQLPLDRKLDQARLFGIKYFLLRSPQMQRLFSQNDQLERVNSFAAWQVFKFKTDTPLATTPTRSPVLTFTELKSRAREVDSYDWLRLNEEWLFHGGYEHILVKNKTMEIDLATELDNFNTALVSEYKYSNIELAYQRLLSLAERGTLVLFSSDDPLYRKLVASGADPTKHIFIVERSKNIRQDMGTVLDILDQHNARLESPGTTLSRTGSKIVVDSSSNFVYIKTSYLPAWQGSDLYLSSPSFMLVHNRGRQFETNFLP